MARRNSLFGNTDFVLILLYLFMVLAGWVNIYSAVYNEEFSNIFDLSQRYGKQLMWIGFSLILAFFILVVDSKFFVSFAYLIYAFFIILLLLVLFVGKEVNGARSWFVIGSFAFQPAEFAKLGTALALARFISRYNFSFNKLRDQFILAFLLLFPVLLIVLENDTGSALVYFVFIMPLFREGMSGLILFFAFYAALLFILSLVIPQVYLILALIVFALLIVLVLNRNFKTILNAVLVLLGAGVLVWLQAYLRSVDNLDAAYIILRASVLTAIVLLPLTIIKRIPQMPLVLSVFLFSVALTFAVDFGFNKILEPHQQSRINHLLGIESDPLGAGYNVNQSKIAIGSGGLLGKGFLQGTQTKYDFVPEQSTDFIFCTVGEEWGFIGSSIVVVAFLTLLLRIVYIAERQRSVFSRVYAYAVASILFFHFAVNVGMTIGLAPVIGIPLPFFSYGGSSLWFFTVLLFVLIKLDSSRLEQLH